MQQNRRIVLISILGVVAAIAIMVFVGTRIFGTIADSVRNSRYSVAVTNDRELDTDSENGRFDAVELQGSFRDFDSIAVVGGWTLTVVHGQEFDVSVSASERVADKVDVYQRGNELTLGLEQGISIIAGNLKAVVTMPDLERIQVDGGVNATITGFDVDELELEIDGAASIRAIDSTFALLDIDVDGAATLDFWESSVYDVVLEMDGAARLSVTMNGGDLTGVLRGVGEVIYRGDVGTADVNIEGLGRVRRR